MGKRKSKTAKKKQAKAASKPKGSLERSFAKKLGVSDKPHRPAPMKIGTPKVEKMKLEKSRKKEVKNRNASEEEKDFKRQQESMVEREQTIEWKRTWHRRSRKLRKAPVELLMEPASFAASDAEKATSQLVQEVVSKVQNLEGIGRAPMMSSLRAALPTAPETAAAWTTNEKLETPNPWAVLDDEETLPAKTPNCTPTSNFFQFAPATFTLGVDVDPDL